MPKFKIGDKVRILDGSGIENYFGGWSKLATHGRHSMEKFVGEVHEIASIDDDDYTRLGRVAYLFAGVPYQWDERSLELAEPKSKFKEGDIVRIRQWDDMAQEFGTFSSGNIRCYFGFTKEMRALCGLRARILGISANERRKDVELQFLDEPELSKDFVFGYSTDMIEPVEDEEIIDVEPEELQPVTTESEDITELIEELGGLF